MFKVIYPAEEHKQKNLEFPGFECWKEQPNHVLFLAGPCPRVNYDEDWRVEAIKYLEEAGFDGIVFSPTNKYFNKDDPTYLEKQIRWEQNAMRKADKVMFWIPRSEKDPAFTTNIELGHYLEPGRLSEFTIGMPDNAIKNNYIKIRLRDLNKYYDNDLKTLVYHTVEGLR